VLGFGGEYRWLVAWSKLAFGGGANVLETVVGGSFADVGARLVRAVTEHGLKDGDHLVDVGCGAGRLAVQLKDWSGLRYSGFDVAPELIAHARTICARPDWRFELLKSPVLPLEADCADMVCFFSVFTHLKPPLIAAYLAESRRVLKPGGRVVASFLDPTVSVHQRPLRGGVIKRAIGRLFYPLNIGFTPDQVRAWAAPAGLKVLRIDSPHAIGQSLAVFEK
jgi:SAM-dependent methyltransferase